MLCDCNENSLRDRPPVGSACGVAEPSLRKSEGHNAASMDTVEQCAEASRRRLAHTNKRIDPKSWLDDSRVWIRIGASRPNKCVGRRREPRPLRYRAKLSATRNPPDPISDYEPEYFHSRRSGNLIARQCLFSNHLADRAGSGGERPTGGASLDRPSPRNASFSAISRGRGACG